MFRSSLVILFVFLFSVSLSAADQEHVLQQEIAKYAALGDKVKEAEHINKLGFHYWDLEQFEEAVNAFKNSVALNLQLGNTHAVKSLYSNIGMLYTDLEEPESALLYFRKSLQVCQDTGDKPGEGASLLNVSIALQSLNRDHEALEYLQSLESLARELKSDKLLRMAYNYLATVYEELGQSEKAMEYFAYYAALKQKEAKEQEARQREILDKEKAEANRKVAVERKKKEEAIEARVVTEKELDKTKDSLAVVERLRMFDRVLLEKQEAVLRSQKLTITLFIIGGVALSLILLLLLFGYRLKQKHNKELTARNEEIKQQNVAIKEKNLHIEQSINYAKSIQNAILPEVDVLRQLFPESFVFFSPLDIVSGDFYWFASLPENPKVKVVASIDCTGHGVPGAFMSMLGMRLLKEAIIEKGVRNPAQVLDEMHEMVRFSLQQEVTGNTDGMDASLCFYNEETRILQFAGAVQSIVYIQEGDMRSIRGDIFGIGGIVKEHFGPDSQYQLSEIKIDKPTTCYLFSDGFADQFGGEDGKKFLMRSFKQLLFDIHHLPMDEQHEKLELTLKQWVGKDYRRLDDVLVIGFKLS